MQGILGDMQRAEALARQRDASHGMIRPEPSTMQRIGSQAKRLFFGDKNIYGNDPLQPSVMDSQYVRPEMAEGAMLDVVGGPMTFAGTGSKLADRQLLKKAKSMLSEASPEDQVWNKNVYQETGWYKDVDGQWKFEIDDSQSQIVDDVYRRWRRYKPLGESKSGKTRVEYYKDLMPDQLSKHYPQTEGTVVGRLPDMGGMYVPTDRGVRGSGKIGIGFPTSYFRRQAEVSDPYTGEIQYPKGTLGTPELDKPFVRRGMLHERQHQIQDIEDFGGGSNERFWQPEGQMPVKAPIGKEREEALKIFEDYGGYKKLHREYKKDGAEAEFFEKYGDRIVELEKKMDTIRSKHFPLGKYHHSSGEVEARNVERRSLLSPQERIETPPWETIDVGRGVGASGAKLEHLGDDPYLLPFTKTDKEVREMMHVITPSEFRRITREWMANRNK